MLACDQPYVPLFFPPMSPAAQSENRYMVKSVLHCSQILACFRNTGEALPLKEIAVRSGLPKTMAFRLLYTMTSCGMVDKVGKNLYQTRIHPLKNKLYRLGYAAQGQQSQFSMTVSASLKRAAEANGIELICLDNRYCP